MRNDLPSKSLCLTNVNSSRNDNSDLSGNSSDSTTPLQNDVTANNCPHSDALSEVYVVTDDKLPIEGNSVVHNDQPRLSAGEDNTEQSGMYLGEGGTEKPIVSINADIYVNDNNGCNKMKNCSSKSSEANLDNSVADDVHAHNANVTVENHVNSNIIDSVTTERSSFIEEIAPPSSPPPPCETVQVAQSQNNAKSLRSENVNSTDNTIHNTGAKRKG